MSRNISVSYTHLDVYKRQDHYLASPLQGCVEGFPPLFVAVRNQEVLQYDGMRFAHKAQKNGVNVTVEIGQGMPHVYPILLPSHPQSIKCFQALKRFLQSIFPEPGAEFDNVKLRK